MKKELSEFYGNSFYEMHKAGMKKSAEIVLDVFYKYFKPQTVIDIGCGQGAWLAAAEKLGAQLTKGIDGPWVNTRNLASKNIDFEACDFSSNLPKIDKKFELCISLEVAEHIPKEKESEFINLLCQSSDTILFSAAIKNQGGQNHINEQWQSHWINEFDSRGYICIDFLRKRLWKNQNVEWWYRQNIFIFVKKSNIDLLNIFPKQELMISDIVHPELFETKTEHYIKMINHPNLKFCAKIFFNYIKNMINIHR